MSTELITTIITTGASVIGFLVSTIIAIIQAVKKSKITKANTLYEKMLEDIETAESMYKNIEATGIDCSTMKKTYVMNELQIYAASTGMEFDKETWSQEVENLITFSKSVNAHDVESITETKVIQ